MTGPAEYEHKGHFDAALFAAAERTPRRERRGRHLRLPAQRRRVRSDPPRSRARRLQRHRGGQYLRRHRRSGAPGAAGDPRAAPRAAARQNRRHRLRGADRAADFRRHGRSRSGARQCGKAQRRVLGAGARRFRSRRRAEGDRQRHHGGQGNRSRIWSRLSRAAPAPSSRCRTAATTAARSASFPTAAAIRARCRWARWSTMCAGSSPTAIARSC